MNSKSKILIFLFLFILDCSQSYSINKQSKLAGRWYPADTAELQKYITTTQVVSQSIQHIPLIIVPHAGYMYSAHIAVKAYKAVSAYKPDVIIIIGPSHYEYFTGFALPVYDAITTPLGTIHIDQKTIKNLSTINLFAFNNNAFEPEHSVEIQLPFIQYYFPETLVIPILVGNINTKQAQQAAKELLKAISHYKKPLFVISSDFTHHGPRFGYAPYSALPLQKRMQHITDLDKKAIEYIITYNPKEFQHFCESSHITICGRNAILCALSLFDDVYTKELLAYSTSAEVTGDYDNTVSYAAIVLTGTLIQSHFASENSMIFDLSYLEKNILLTLARKSIETMLHTQTLLQYKDPIPPQCAKNAGAFVTLTINGYLRGCIGYIEPVKPLYQTVIECAASAAFNDPRFKPLTNEELKKVDIEITVLSPLKPISSLEELRPGTDGLVVAKGNRRGVLLPQVATEFGFTTQQFFDHTCQKAGIHPYEYDSVTMYTFTVNKFSEKDINTKKEL